MDSLTSETQRLGVWREPVWANQQDKQSSSLESLSDGLRSREGGVNDWIGLRGPSDEGVQNDRPLPISRTGEPKVERCCGRATGDIDIRRLQVRMNAQYQAKSYAWSSSVQEESMPGWTRTRENHELSEMA